MLSSLYWVLDIVYKRREKKDSSNEGRKGEGGRETEKDSAGLAVLCGVLATEKGNAGLAVLCGGSSPSLIALSCILMHC